MTRSILTPLAMLLATAAPTVALAQTTLNVRDADIRAFIADATKVTGRTFVIDSRVQGKVTVVTDRPLSRSEYLEIFLSTLRSNGLVAVPIGNGAFRIQPIDNAAQQPSRVGTAGANRNSFVTEIVRLRQVDAQSALDTVRPLVSQQGSVSANRAGNSLVIVDFADNIRRVREVLRRLDTDAATTRIVPLRNASAREVAAALQSLSGAGQAGGGGVTPGAGVAVVAVEGANAVAIRGDGATVARLAQIARDLDTQARNGTEIKVVFLENADAEQLLPVLQQLVGQAPEQPSSTPLSRANFGTSASGTGTPTSTGRIAQPAAPTLGTPSPGGGGTSQAAITTQGGRTAAVVTRFSGANAIVIAAPGEVQRQLAEVIRQLDTRRQQVLVEAIVAEVSDSTVNRLGAQFLLGNLSGGAFAASTFSNSAPNILQIAGAVAAQTVGGTTTTVVAADGSRTTTTTPNTASTQLTQSAINSILGTSGGFAGFGGQVGQTIFASIINAVKSDTTSNLLQVPHLVTMENQEAHSLVGQEIPVTTGQALSTNFDNAFRTTQRENVGIGLDFKPQVSSSGAIKLNLHIQISSVAGPVSSDNSDLITNKREVETTLTLDDGAIGVIGGLLSDEERRTIEKIPLLGDIPLVGNLFKSKARSRTKTNLMIFVRPTILRTAEDSRRLAERRYGYLRLQDGLQKPGEEPNIDQLVREYMGAAPPIPTAPVPGSIDDPRVGVPVQQAVPDQRKR